MEYNVIKELEMIEKNLTNYNQSIFKFMLSSFICDANKQILDFGSGIGIFANMFYKLTNKSPDCLEICDIQKNILQNRNLRHIDNLYDEKNMILFIH